MSKLQAVRDLLAKPENWMQGDYHNPEKTCFCLLGALQHAHNLNLLDDVNLFTVEYFNDRDTLRRILKDSPIAWNDAEERTHAEVLALLDKAIANV